MLGSLVAMETQVVRSSRRRKTIEGKLVDGVLRVMIPDTLSSDEERHWVEKMRRRVMSKTSSHSIDLEERAAELARAHDLHEPHSIEFSTRQTMRWGSCTPETGAIRLSERLKSYPSWVLDYVIVHELAHLIEANHTPRFWNIVRAQIPRMERARSWLGENGQLLEEEI